MERDPLLDYPLGERRPELVSTPAGTPLAEVTLEGLRSGRVAPDELRTAPETLLRQAAVARAAGREQLAQNLERAAELASLPEDEVLAVYTALRPRRATAAELELIARHLSEVAAPRCSSFVREAAAVMAERGLLRAAE
ncbi:MAG: propanediol dehydratase small subunit [Gaiellales bacterium]|jgi:propanediol dehydratase small subunit|nr:propanediol dehydratase small subunit [Gaiellales bacterium]